ncbi:MAG TPA: TonB family protein [Opitutaceae bacterium]|nr:TonB family protein [Opitutaceae bacterium]
MKRRRFALPAAFALTLLAFLLFGFTKTSRAPVQRTGERFILLDHPLTVIEPSPEPEDAEKASSKNPGPPTQEERFEPVDAEHHPDFIVPVPTPPAPSLATASLVDPGIFRPGGEGPDFSGGGTMVDVAMLDEVPRARVRIPPAYPAAARAAGIVGEVLVEFAVDPSGRVLNPRVVRSSDRSFDEPTLRAVSRWVFEPGRREGRPVSFRLVVPVVYRLGD